MMYGIISNLPGSILNQFTKLHQKVRLSCSNKNCFIPEPFLIWTILNDYTAEMNTELRNISGKTNPFTINTSGFGVITDNNGTLYLNVVNSIKVFTFQKILIERLNQISPGLIFKNCPRIDLACGLADLKNIGDAVRHLYNFKNECEIEINNIGIVYYDRIVFQQRDTFHFNN